MIDRTGTVVQKRAAATITKVDDGEDGPGGFDALVAVFGNLDSQGDRVLKGAFTDSITARNGQFPSLWAHQFHDVDSIIGGADAEETDDGLLWHTTFLDTPRAQHVRQLMKQGLIREFSWSGRVVEGAFVDSEDEEPYYEIRKVDLWEAGPCFIGANSETEVLGIKAFTDGLTTKEGRVLAQRHVDSLKSIHDTLTGVIAAVEKPGDKSGKAEPPPFDQGGDLPPGPQNPPADPVGFVVPASLKARLALTRKEGT